MLSRLALSAFAVLGIIYLVPLALYALGSRFVSMPAPEDAGPARFLGGVLVTKIGTAVAFTGLYWLSRDAWGDRWLAYAALWFFMFAASELGDLITRRSTSAETIIGIASEAIYAPFSAWVVGAVLG